MSAAACCKICTEAARIRNSWLLQVVEDFGLLRFMPLHVEDKHSMAALLRSVDKANGYAFSGRPDAQAMQSYSAVATGTSPHLWPLAYCVVCLLCSSAVLSSAMIVACRECAGRGLDQQAVPVHADYADADLAADFEERFLPADVVER